MCIVATVPTQASHPMHHLNLGQGRLGGESHDSEGMVKFIVAHMDVVKSVCCDIICPNDTPVTSDSENNVGCSSARRLSPYHLIVRRAYGSP
jgi:hypothetical protein